VTLPFDPSGPALHDGIYGLPHSPEEARVVLVPVPWEPTTSYGRGTARGPAAILAASRQVDLFDRETGRPYEAGIALLAVDPEILAWNAEACAASEPIIAAGGVIAGDAELEARLARVNELGARLDARVAGITREWLARGKIVGLVGGDHASPFGALRAHAERYPGLGVLHIDAHADLRVAYEGFQRSHASILHNVAAELPGVAKIVQLGLRDVSEEEAMAIDGSNGRIVAYFDGELAARQAEGEPFARIARELVEHLPREVYITFDIDGLDPTLCPHTGTPVPGGLSYRDVLVLLRVLCSSGRRLVGFDLVEVAPGPDGDEWDANVAARLLYKMIGWALRAQ
jgi:agmatinase